MSFLTVLILAAQAMPTSPANTADCRPLGKYIHCYNPPPATPMTAAESKAMHDRIVAEEREILAPVAAGFSSSSCASALRAAEVARRFDLVRLINRRCAP